MAAPLKYNPQYHDDWAWSLAMKGATDEEIAEAFHISRRTITRWRKDYESFDKALSEGKATADSSVERSLYKRACGYETKDVEQIIEDDPVTGKKTVTRQRVTTKEIPPDTMAIMYWLNNRTKNTGAEWSQRQEVALTNETGAHVAIFLPAQEDDEDD